MKKFILGILSIVCVCFVMDAQTVSWAADDPCLVEGTCHGGTWNGSAFEGCDNGPGTCECTTTSGKQTFTCLCSGDLECGDDKCCNNGYCESKSCDCDPTTQKIDACNYKTTSCSDCTCSGACTSCTTSYGCYTSGSDSTGNFDCVED